MTVALYRLFNRTHTGRGNVEKLLPLVDVRCPLSVDIADAASPNGFPRARGVEAATFSVTSVPEPVRQTPAGD